MPGPKEIRGTFLTENRTEHMKTPVIIHPSIRGAVSWEWAEPLMSPGPTA